MDYVISAKVVISDNINSTCNYHLKNRKLYLKIIYNMLLFVYTRGIWYVINNYMYIKIHNKVIFRDNMTIRLYTDKITNNIHVFQFLFSISLFIN